MYVDRGYCAGVVTPQWPRQQDVVGPSLETALGNGKQEAWARPWLAPLVHPVDGGPWWNIVTEALHVSHSHWEFVPGLEDGRNSIAFRIHMVALGLPRNQRGTGP